MRQQPAQPSQKTGTMAARPAKKQRVGGLQYCRGSGWHLVPPFNVHVKRRCIGEVAQPRLLWEQHRRLPISLDKDWLGQVDLSKLHLRRIACIHQEFILPVISMHSPSTPTHLEYFLHIVLHLHARHVLALRRDGDQLVLIHNLLKRRVDEVVEGVELLPHQALLLKVG